MPAQGLAQYNTTYKGRESNPKTICAANNQYMEISTAGNTIAGCCPLQFSHCRLRLRIEYATSSTVQQLLVWTAILLLTAG